MAPLHFLSAFSVLALSLYTSVSLAEPGVIGLTFSKREITNPAEPAYRLRKRSGTAAATLYNAQGDLLYLINTTVGTPPQKIALQLDTGSSDIWIPWAGSTICEGSTSRCTNGAYDDSKSSTFVDVAPDEFLISYVDGTKIAGDYINETFSVGGANIKQMRMGVAKQAQEPGADDTTPFQGIMGVGFDSGESIVSQKRGQAGYPNIISQMVLQGAISTRAYSLWLNDLDSAEGNILFGGIDNAKFHGDLTILPLQSDTETNTIDTFTVTFAGLEVTGNGGKTVYTTTSTTPVILDSGTTLTYLPDDMAAAINAGVGAVDNNDYGTVVPCEVANTQGVFKFKFGNQNGPVVVAGISQFVLPFPSDVPSPKFRNGKTACRWGILPAAGSPNLFGDTFLRSAYVVYNIDGLEVGIAQTNFNVSDTEIKQITATSSLPGASSTATGTAQQTRTGAIYNTNGIGFGSAASTAVATQTSGTFDLGSPTASSRSGGGSGTSSKAAAAGLTAPSGPFVGAIVGGISLLFAMVGGSMLVFV